MNQNTGKDEIKEFMTGAENKRKRQNRKKRRRSSEQYTVAVAGLILMAVIFVVVGIFACRVPVVPVCILALLEVILARCFYDLRASFDRGGTDHRRRDRRRSVVRTDGGIALFCGSDRPLLYLSYLRQNDLG